jgi:hypothetical protein
LAAALDTAQQARLDPAEVFDGAWQLGIWSLRNERYDTSARAWSIAANFTEGSRLPPQRARGIALTGQAAALILSEVGERRGRLNYSVATDAYGMLIEALNTLAAAPGYVEGEVTPVLRSYAEALAWRAVLHAKLRSDNQDIPEVQEAQGDGADGLNEVAVPQRLAEQPRCLVGVRPRHSARLYPEEALNENRLGGVAVLFRIDESGEIIGIEALASVGGAEFGEAVENRRAWRVVRREDSPANCRMAMSVIQSVSFQLGG